MFIKFIITVVLVEAITELVIKSRVFRKLRECVSRKSNFLKELLMCGYCFAFYASVICVLWLKVTLILSGWVGMIVALFIIHRCSSHLHDLTHIFVKHQKGKDG